MAHTTLWIDHEKAYIFQFEGQGMKEKVVEGSRHPDEEHLKKFYHEVAVLIGRSDQVLLVGPGQAKHEFKRHCEDHHHENLARAIVGIETMKEHPRKSEILDVSRRFFHHHFAWNGMV